MRGGIDCMKRILAICLAIWMLMPISAGALSRSPKAEYTSGVYTARPLEDGTCEIIACDGWNAEVLPIPSWLDGKRVTRIGEGVFENFWDVRTFLIPEGIVHIGNRAFYGCENTVNIRLPESLVSIGERAFVHCRWSNLQIPDGVTSIGTDAFAECQIDWIEGAHESALAESEEVYTARDLGDGTCEITGFTGDGGNLLLPKTIGGKPVSAIGAGAFEGLDNLDTIRIPEGVKKISDGAFRNCRYLTEVEFPQTLQHIGCDAFADTALIHAVLPEGIVSIGDRAFRHCKKLIYLSVPQSAETLGSGMIEGCDALVAVLGHEGSAAEEMAETVQAAFARCDQTPQVFGCGAYIALDLGNLTCVILSYSETGESKDGTEEKVTIPKTLEGRTVVGIAAGAFESLEEIDCLQIPPSVTGIGKDAFVKAFEVVIPDSLMLTGVNPFAGDELFIGSDGASLDETDCVLYTEGDGWLRFENGLLIDNSGRLIDAANASGDVLIPESVTSIGDGAFMNCSELSSVAMPAGVTSIGVKAFAGCESLKHISLPEGLKSIEDMAFYGCTMLERLEIPESVTNVGRNPFVGVSGLQCASAHAKLRIIDGLLIDNAERRVVYAAPELERITVPDGIAYIGDYAFAECSDLAQAALPRSLTHIGDGAFFWDMNLESIELPEKVEFIGCSAFDSCHQMSSLTICGSDVTIGRYAFASCDSLERVTILGENVKLGGHAFDSDMPGTEPALKEIMGYPGSGAGEAAELLGVDFVSIE